MTIFLSEHLVCTSHTANKTDVSGFVFKVPIQLYRITRERIFDSAEDITIYLQNPIICQQKGVHNLYTQTCLDQNIFFSL